MTQKRIKYVAGKTKVGAGFDPEGKQVEFSIEDVAIVCDPESMLSLAANLARLGREAIMQQAKSGTTHGIAQVVPLADAGAQAPEGKEVVSLVFRETTGIVHHFGMPPEKSERLRSEMAVAEAQARKNGQTTKH